VTYKARIAVIAGSDSGGGAGIQADIKTITALGGYAMTVVTAITAQNTLGVAAVHMIPNAMVAAQFHAIMDDIGADAIKIGMLGNQEMIACVAGLLKAKQHIPIILDPVMQAKGGAALLEDTACTALKTTLLPYASLLTPNIPEAERLCGFAIHTHADRERACLTLVAAGAKAVLLKGGHSDAPVLRDILYDGYDFHTFDTPRINTAHTHGTGCTFASAVTTFLAQGAPMKDAVANAQSYVRRAILSAPEFGKGHGPLWHMVTK
jgi:hydroxymethylpyrimidine/phosphomethylpyrimidine kinase